MCDGTTNIHSSVYCNHNLDELQLLKKPDVNCTLNDYSFSLDHGLATLQDHPLPPGGERQCFHQHPRGHLGGEMPRDLLPFAVADDLEGLQISCHLHLGLLPHHHTPLGRLLQAADTL